jgi:hypothetical protein
MPDAVRRGATPLEREEPDAKKLRAVFLRVVTLLESLSC